MRSFEKARGSFGADDTTITHGLSKDVKPTDFYPDTDPPLEVINGDTAYDMDTGHWWMFDGENKTWIDQTALQNP